MQMYPTTKLVGEGAVARLNSILVAPEGSHLDIGGTSTADKTAGFKPKGCTAFWRKDVLLTLQRNCKMLVDLHTHSTFSDGRYTPSQLVKMADEPV